MRRGVSITSQAFLSEVIAIFNLVKANEAVPGVGPLRLLSALSVKYYILQRRDETKTRKANTFFIRVIWWLQAAAL